MNQFVQTYTTGATEGAKEFPIEIAVEATKLEGAGEAIRLLDNVAAAAT